MSAHSHSSSSFLPVVSRMASVNAASAPFVAPSSRRRMSIITTAESGDVLFGLPSERHQRRGSVVSVRSAISATGSAGAAGVGPSSASTLPAAADDIDSEDDSDDEDDAVLDVFLEPQPLRIDPNGGATILDGAPLSPALSANSRNAISNAKLSSASLGAGQPGDMPTAPRFSQGRKRFILATVAAAGMVAPLCTTVYLPAIHTIQQDLQTTELLINLTVTLFVIVLAIAPLVWAPISDSLGRRPVYLISLSLLVVASAACAGSVNVGMLMAFRMLQATGSSSVLSIGAGTLSDIFEPEERGQAMGLFFLGPLVGPVIGPMIGGVLSQYAGWRWIFGFVSIVSFIILVLIYFVLPETLKKTAGGPKKRPNLFATMLELRHPFVSLVIVDVCVVFMSLYGVSTLFGRQMADTYGFSDSVVGFLFVGQGIGNIAGSVFGGWYADRTMAAGRRPDERTGILPPPVPEHRLITTWVGAVLLPGGLLIYGWGLQNALPFAVPLVGTVLLGAGLMSFSTSTNTYLVDCYPRTSASIISLNNCFRYLVSACAPLFVPSIIKAIGVGWTQTMFACMNWVAWLGVLSVWWFGTGWREARSPWKDERMKEVEKREKLIKEIEKRELTAEIEVEVQG